MTAVPEPARITSADDLLRYLPGPVLVVAPHPDDEAIGPGGTIARLTAADVPVHVLYLTSGELGAPGRNPAEVLEWRERDARAAADVLGLASTTFWEFPDGTLRDLLYQNLPIERRLGAFATDLGADTVLIPHEHESHSDHHATYRLAARVAAQGLMRPHTLATYEVWTPMQYYDLAVDITEVVDVKLEAIRAQRSQVDRIAFDDAALGLARFRGALHNRPHGTHAEVFQII